MIARVIDVSAGTRVGRMITAAPDRLLLALFWTCLAVAVTVTFNVFHPWLVTPLALGLVIATWRLAPTRLAATTVDVVSTVVVLIGAAAWVVVNAPHAARYVVTTRDPGFLTLAGIWLSEHPSVEIPVARAVDVAEQFRDVFPTTGAYALVGDVLQVQGAALVPGLLAIGGWVGGIEGVLTTNLVLGAAALVGVFALTRRIAGSIWALVPTTALATSMPMLAFSRGAYTEPVVAALLLGGLVMVWSAFSTRRPADFALAGAMVGAGALARIDGLALVVGLAVGAGLGVGATNLPRVRRRLRINYLWMVTAALLVAGLGLSDLALHSRDYLGDLGPQIGALLTATFVAVLLGVLMTTSMFAGLRRSLRTRRTTWAWISATAISIAAVALASRPLWLIERRLDPEGGYGAVVAALQTTAGVTIDPGRSYDEQSVTWLAWYLGAPAVVLALGGLAAMVWASARRRDPRLVVLAAVIGAPTLLYLVRISITPDHIWAMRRFLPVTIPGFLVVATWSCVELWRWGGDLLARSATLGRAWQAGIIALAGTVALAPVTTWAPVLRTADFGGQLGQLRAVCGALSASGASQVVYVNGGMPYLASLVTVCGTDVVEIRETPSPQQLRSVHRAWGSGTTAVVAMSLDHVPWSTPPVSPVVDGPITLWEQTVTRRPTEATSWNQSIWVGTIQDDGTVLPLP